MDPFNESPAPELQYTEFSTQYLVRQRNCQEKTLFWGTEIVKRNNWEAKKFWGKEIGRRSYCDYYQDDAKPHLPTDDLKLTDKQVHLTTVRSRRSSFQVKLLIYLCLRLWFFSFLDWVYYVAIIQFMLWNIQVLELLYEHTLVALTPRNQSASRCSWMRKHRSWLLCLQLCFKVPPHCRLWGWPVYDYLNSIWSPLIRGCSHIMSAKFGHF